MADLVFVRDMTQRKQLQIQLSQAQKLESIGQLAAGIAHEINTPTQYVGDNTRFLQGSFHDLFGLIEKYRYLLKTAKEGEISQKVIAEVERTEDNTDLEYLSEEIPKAIQQSLEGIDRVAKIVRAMKEFSHPGTKEKKAIDINKAIETTITIARNEWKYVSEMVTDFDSSLPLVPCLPDDLNQVILNIIINAAHAIAGTVGDGSKGKGTITIKTSPKDGEAEIRISDTGTGIPEEIRNRIFDPFFTTKEVGKGTGQGLTIAHSIIVKKHGGSLSFETEVGKGTTFIISLPIELKANH
jgi:signal transduction histidine kinase